MSPWRASAALPSSVAALVSPAVAAAYSAGGGDGGAVMAERQELLQAGGGLQAFWTGTPLDRQRTSHLARLELGLAA
jgi:hypothetical protein